MKSDFAKRLYWLPNAITVSRCVLSLVAFYETLQRHWVAAFWIFGVALASDFLDGLAAKKLHAMSELGAKIDGIADGSIVVAGLLGLSLTGHLSWWITGLVFVVGLVISSDKFIRQPRWRWRAVLAVGSLFVAWIAVMWMYASVAFGWSWLYAALTLLVLAVCGLLKQHRIRAWLRGKRAKRLKL